MKLVFIRKKSTIALLIIGMLIMLFYATPLKKTFGEASTPLHRIGGVFYSSTQRFRSAWNAVVARNELISELESLQTQNALLEKERAESAHLQEENEQLKSLLNYTQSSGYSIISTTVLSYNTTLDTHTFTIPLGAQDGVRIGVPVIAKEGVLVGKIIETNEHTSVARSITDRQSVIAVTVPGHSDIQAITKGAHGLSLVMELIGEDTDIQHGDAIVTSILEEHTPFGLLVGKVSLIEHTEGELFANIYLDPFYSLPALRNVGVIIGLQ